MFIDNCRKAVVTAHLEARYSKAELALSTQLSGVNVHRSSDDTVAVEKPIALKEIGSKGILSVIVKMVPNQMVARWSIGVEVAGEPFESCYAKLTDLQTKGTGHLLVITDKRIGIIPGRRGFHTLVQSSQGIIFTCSERSTFLYVAQEILNGRQPWLHSKFLNIPG